MEVETSVALQKVARRYGLTTSELAYADLLCLGWDEKDAWAMAIRMGITWTKTALKESINELSKKDGVKRRIADYKAQLHAIEQTAADELANGSPKDLLDRATNKERKIIELQAKLETCKDQKLWLAINQQILDVTRMKQEEVKTDDNTVHYYLPVSYPTSCKDCLLCKK